MDIIWPKVYLITSHYGAVIILLMEEWWQPLELANAYSYMIRDLLPRTWSWNSEFKVNIVFFGQNGILRHINYMIFWLPTCYRTYKHFQKFVGHLSNIVGCKFSPDSALLITASWDTKVNIWDSISGELKRSLLHVVPPPQLVFSPHIRALSLNKFSTAISTGMNYIGKQSR